MKPAKEWLDECPGETDQSWDGGTEWFERPTVEWVEKIQADALRADEKAGLLDWAETLLCNSLPMSHCTQEEWDRIIKSWRDQKHGASAPNARADLPRIKDANRESGREGANRG
jgi:hypothetical protein